MWLQKLIPDPTLLVKRFWMLSKKDLACQELDNAYIFQFSSQGPFQSDLGLPFKSHLFIDSLNFY